MAKTREARGAAATPTVAQHLSAKLQKMVDAIRKPFNSYLKEFTIMQASREELAPKFMQTARAWQAEQNKDFVAFVRYLVPEIGTGREYRSHRAYQAADYLRRLDNQVRARAEGGGRRVAGRRGLGRAGAATAADALARVLKSFLPIIPEAQQRHLWEAMQAQLGWTERQVSRLDTQVETVEPIVDIRGRQLDNLRLTVHVPAEVAEQEEVAA